MNLLFDALRDAPRAAKIKEVYGFDLNRFHEMKGSNEIFGDPGMRARLASHEEALAALQNALPQLET